MPLNIKSGVTATLKSLYSYEPTLLTWNKVARVYRLVLP